MQDFPLLDLQSAWQDAQRCLTEAQTLIELLYYASDQSWYDLSTLRTQVKQALQALSTMPGGIVESIAKDETDWEEMETHNPN